ncbi:MAG: response regulator [bacterium]|jgi:CheY-like chemotaxis protein
MGTRPTGRDNGDGTILLVEDSDLVREVIARMLGEEGFTILPVSSGEDALSILRRKEVSIDLLLTDIVMPEMTGLELADRISEEMPDVPILFMTGYSEEVVESKGISGKNREWIPKPFTQEEIVSKAREILSR